MLNFPRPVSSQLIEDTLSEILASRIKNADIQVRVDRDNTPWLMLVDDHNDYYISVRIRTVEIEENGEVIGWGFIPTVSNKAMSFELDASDNYADAAEVQYKHWTEVGNIAKQIAEFEFIPREWADFEDIFY